MVQSHQGLLLTCITQEMEIRKLLVTLNAARMVDLFKLILHEAQEQHGNNNRNWEWKKNEAIWNHSQKPKKGLPLRSDSKCLEQLGAKQHCESFNLDTPRCNREGQRHKA